MKSYPLNPQPNITNFKQLVAINATAYPEDAAFQFQINKKIITITYQRFQEDIQALASYFFQKGLS